MSRDTYYIDANVILANPISGIDEVAIVKHPAIELEGFMLSKKNESVLDKLNFNTDKMQIAGYFSLSDFPIYRRDEDGYEYDLVFGKDSTRIMHQKMMEIKIADGFKINFEHRDAEALKVFKDDLTKLGFTNGDIPANIFSIDYIDTDVKKEFIKQQYGIEIPAKYKDSDGSFMVVQITDKDYFNFLKENGIKSFSLEGFFAKVYQELKIQFKNKQINMKRQFFRKPAIKGAKRTFSFQFKKETFATKEDILLDIPVGTDYAELLGDESYKGFTGKEEWIDSTDGTYFEIIVENGIVTDIVIVEDETETEDVTVEETPMAEEDKPVVEEPTEEKKEMTEEEKAMIEEFINAKFAEVIEPKIDEVVEMITELRATFEDDKIKEGEETLNKQNPITNKKDAFKSVIKNYLLNK